MSDWKTEKEVGKMNTEMNRTTMTEKGSLVESTQDTLS
jgi:hypothetical protein